MKQQYAIVVTHDYVDDVNTFVFEDITEARAYMLWYWKRLYNTEIKFSGEDSLKKDLCYCTGLNAKIVYSTGDTTELLLSKIETPIKDFNYIREREELNKLKKEIMNNGK